MRTGGSLRKRYRMAGVFLISILTPGLFAQSGQGKPQFEAISIKPSGPFAVGNMRVGGLDGRAGQHDPGRVTFENYPMIGLLMTAFDMRFDQISGPDWLRVRASADLQDSTYPQRQCRYVSRRTFG